MNNDTTSELASLNSVLSWTIVSLSTTSILLLITELDTVPNNRFTTSKSHLDYLQVADSTEDIIGVAGLPGLWFLIAPYMYGNEDMKIS